MSFEAGKDVDFGLTACERLCPRVVLHADRIRRPYDTATATEYSQFTAPAIRKAVRETIVATVASAPANIKAAWTCPMRHNTENWEPTEACADAARDMGKTFHWEGVRVTRAQAAVLEATGVEFYFDPQIID